MLLGALQPAGAVMLLIMLGGAATLLATLRMPSRRWKSKGWEPPAAAGTTRLPEPDKQTDVDGVPMGTYELEGSWKLLFPMKTLGVATLGVAGVAVADDPRSWSVLTCAY